MSYDFYLDPSEVRKQAHGQIKELEADNELLGKTIYYLSCFIADESLTSLAFKGLKQKVEDIRLAKTAKRSANESLIADYQLLIEYVGDEILDGEQIRIGIKVAEGIISNLSTSRRRLRALQLISSVNPIFDSDINSSLKDVNTQIDYQENIIAVLENKIDTYWEIERTTSQLFSNDKQLRNLIEPGIFAIVKAAQGLPDSYNSPAIWRKDIKRAGMDVIETIELANRKVNVLKLLRGCHDTIAMMGDPVNSATGNFIYPTTDLSISGRFPLEFKRFYNSQSDYVGSLGKGWTHNYEIRLTEQVNKNKEKLTSIQFGEDGHYEHFKMNDNGEYISPKGKFSKLEKTEDGKHILTYPDKSYYLFNEQGMVQLFKNNHGHETKFEYDQSKHEEVLLIKVSTLSGHLVFSYTENNQLAFASDHSGRSIKFKYSKERNALTSFTTLNGYEAKYEYDPENRLVKIINESGNVVLENTFDGYDRAIKQVFPDNSVMEYTYANDTAEFIERNKTKTIYKQDTKYRTTQIIYPNSGKEEFGYNENNQRNKHSDQAQVLQMLANYDESGNILSIINAVGIATEFTYTKDNQISKIKIDGKEKLTKTYDQEGNLLAVKDALKNKTALEYIANGIPQTIIKPDGSKITLAYDERKNITKINSAGLITQYQYDNLNRPIASTDGNGNKTHYQYDHANNIIAVKNAQGKTQKYEYNKNNKVIATTDFAGSVVKHEYNKLNKPAKLIDQLGRETKFAYDDMWNLAQVTHPNGGITSYLYNVLGQLKAKRLPNGGIVEYYYDIRGRKIGVIDELGNKTAFKYDDLGQLIAIKSKGVDVTCEYNAEGRIIFLKDGGISINLTYNEMEQLTSEQNAVGDIRKYTYTPLGKIATIVDEANRITKYDYELGGRLKSITYPDKTKESCTYDLNGNIKTIKQKTGEKLTYDYDSLNRMIGIKSSLGGTKLYTYDALSNITSMTDELGNTTHYEYTLTGRLSKVIDAIGNITMYMYDEMDQIIEIRHLGTEHASIAADLGKDICLNEENKIHITRYERDKMGQVTQITDAYGHKEKFKYDLKGQLIEKVDREGHLTKFTYTNTGNIKQIQYDDGKEIKMKYNSSRQLTEIENYLGITKISSDKLGRVIEVTDHNDKVVAYDWGKMGEKRKITYPDGTVINYDYDELLRLKVVDDGTNKTNYFYDQQSRLTEKLFQNGLKTTYAYNSCGKIAEISHLNDITLLDKFEYDYDLAGNKTTIKKYRRNLPEDTGEFSYSYDPLNRLHEVVKDGERLRSYAYDEYSNRIKKIEQSNEVNYTYNTLNQLISTVNTAGDRSPFTYDKRGNVVGVYSNEDLVNQYSFNPLNQLEKVINYKTNQESSYRYNGFGQRIGRATVPSEFLPTKQIDDVLDITKRYHNLLERGGTNYVWDTNLLSAINNDMTRDYLLDSAGSTVRVGADVLGYEEFGALLTEPNDNQPFGFTGYQFDEVANTWHAHAREYNGAIGRFMNEDVVKGLVHQPLTQNLYPYCFNMPLNFVDLDGNWGYDEHYEITKLAAQLLGFAADSDFVQTVHKNNKTVDAIWEWPWNNSSPVPLIGDQSMHIDHSWWWQQDSRTTHADNYLKKAIATFPYDEERALLYLGRGSHPIQDMHAHGQLGSGPVPPNDWALMGFLIPGTTGTVVGVTGWALGQRGHAAHSVLPNRILLGNPDRLNYDWANDAQTSFRRIPYQWSLNGSGELYSDPALRFNERFIAAVLDTEAYLRQFMEATGFTVKDSLY